MYFRKEYSFLFGVRNKGANRYLNIERKLTMRIISGIRRGHKLTEIKREGIRPTTDRVKESMFNLITPYIADAEVLDLFCGSGALAFEALSRGAAKAVCVDKSSDSISVIKKNCDSLDFSDKTDIINADAFDFLKRTGKSFDIIFLDPPYNKGFVKQRRYGRTYVTIYKKEG